MQRGRSAEMWQDRPATCVSRSTPETRGQWAHGGQLSPGLRENGFCVTLLVKNFT